jgi:hypothetical protein
MKVIKLKKSIIVTITLFIVLLILPVSHASEEVTGSDFAVTPIDPDTGEIQSSYFDLVVKPQQELELNVRIHNHSSEEMKIKVEANNGSTNSNGITSYISGSDKDTSLKVAFSDISNLIENIVTVPAKDTSTAVIKIKIPQEEFSGVILGGLRFSDATERKKTDSEKTITNNIVYTVGVILRENEVAVEPKMNLLGVAPEQRDSRNYIGANLQNSAPRIIEELKVNAKVYDKKTDKLSYETTNESMRMAPNSNFSFGIDLENSALIAGEYTLKLSGTADGFPFYFEKDFSISQKVAKELNESSVFVKTNNHNTLIVLGLSIIVILLTIILILIVKRKKDSEPTKPATDV